MSDPVVHLYEGLFLVTQNAAQDLEACETMLRGVLERAEAEIITLQKWDERKLAYPIKGQRRGTYFLAYFNARGTQIANIERDVTLSEDMVRCLIIRADHFGDTELDLAKKGEKTWVTEKQLREGEEGESDQDDRRSGGQGGSGVKAVASPKPSKAATATATAEKDEDNSDDDES